MPHNAVVMSGLSTITVWDDPAHDIDMPFARKLNSSLNETHSSRMEPYHCNFIKNSFHDLILQMP